MNEENITNLLTNRAELEGIHHLDENCFEQVVYCFNSNGRRFSISLSAIMHCLELAKKNGDLPKLPSSWCFNISENLPIEFDDDVFYDDFSEIDRWKTGSCDEMENG